MTTWLLVMVGAAIGAPSRWLVDQAIGKRHDSVFPWGTFTVNMVGSFLLGLLFGLSLDGDTHIRMLALAGTGFCGAFTTFSTYSYESVVLMEEGSSAVAVLNVVSSVIVGLALAFAGWALGGVIVA